VKGGGVFGQRKHLSSTTQLKVFIYSNFPFEHSQLHVDAPALKFFTLRAAAGMTRVVAKTRSAGAMRTITELVRDTVQSTVVMPVVVVNAQMFVLIILPGKQHHLRDFL
jgi:hypothetical protein